MSDFLLEMQRGTKAKINYGEIYVDMRKTFRIMNRTNRLQHLMTGDKFMKKVYYEFHYVLLMLKINNFVRHQTKHFQKEILVIEKLHGSTPNSSNINDCITMIAKKHICFDKK